MHRLLSSLVLLSTLIFMFNCHATQSEHFFNGSKKVILLANNGAEVVIGNIHFNQKKQTINYQLQLNHQHFADYFLSMKEMKCLEGPELWCHLAYPYQNPHSIETGDFRWLAHDFLFMYKKKSDFGANFYNGIYYQFSLVNNVLVGHAMAIDLNILAAPPDDTTTPPIGEYDVEELDPSTRWLPRIEIR